MYINSTLFIHDNVKGYYNIFLKLILRPLGKFITELYFTERYLISKSYFTVSDLALYIPG